MPSVSRTTWRSSPRPFQSAVAAFSARAMSVSLPGEAICSARRRACSCHAWSTLAERREQAGLLREGPDPGTGVRRQQPHEQPQRRPSQVLRVRLLHAAGDVDHYPHVGALRGRRGRRGRVAARSTRLQPAAGKRSACRSARACARTCFVLGILSARTGQCLATTATAMPVRAGRAIGLGVEATVGPLVLGRTARDACLDSPIERRRRDRPIGVVDACPVRASSASGTRVRAAAARHRHRARRPRPSGQSRDEGHRQGGHAEKGSKHRRAAIRLRLLIGEYRDRLATPEGLVEGPHPAGVGRDDSGATATPPFDHQRLERLLRGRAVEGGQGARVREEVRPHLPVAEMGGRDRSTLCPVPAAQR